MTLFMFGVLALGLASPVSAWGTDCLTNVGSCMIGSCSSSRGPTQCSWGQCNCLPGFCAVDPPQDDPMESSLLDNYCVQRIPDKTCQVSTDCTNAGSFCVGAVAGGTFNTQQRGMCSCKRGMVLDGTQCVPGASGAVLLAAGNSDFSMLATVGNSYKFECDGSFGTKYKMDCSSGKDGTMTVVVKGPPLRNPIVEIPNCGATGSEYQVKREWCTPLTSDFVLLG